MSDILSILILGGTSFLGPHLVHELQNNGHQVTLFNRGTQKIEFTHIEQLHGDRDGNLEALKDRNWDAVIDTSGTIPRLVEDSSKILAKSTKHYTFISSVSVYKDFHQQQIDESYPVATLDDENTYPGLKAASENIVMRYFPNYCLIIRPGLIVGPLDPTDRFTYWPVRIDKGGEILAPGSPDQLLQFIDVRDLAKWIVILIEKQTTGIYNATGPADPITFEQVLLRCQQICAKNSSFTWVSEDFLLHNQIQDWIELPLWLSYKRNMPGFLNVSIKNALQNGLAFRPLSETIRDTLDWHKTRESIGRIGLDRDKEQALLKLWKEKN